MLPIRIRHSLRHFRIHYSINRSNFNICKIFQWPVEFEAMAEKVTAL